MWLGRGEKIQNSEYSERVNLWLRFHKCTHFNYIPAELCSFKSYFHYKLRTISRLTRYKERMV